MDPNERSLCVGPLVASGWEYSHGSKEFPCKTCGEAVMIGLGNQKILASEAGGDVMCLGCAVLQMAGQEAGGDDLQLLVIGDGDPAAIPERFLPMIRRLLGLE